MRRLDGHVRALALAVPLLQGCFLPRGGLEEFDVLLRRLPGRLVPPLELLELLRNRRELRLGRVLPSSPRLAANKAPDSSLLLSLLLSSEQRLSARTIGPPLPCQ